MGATLYNCHDLINSFYNDKVYLSEDEKNKLRNFREINIKRVKDGTDKLSENDGVCHQKFVEDKSQGSMAMHTINQAQFKDNHDIDHALIYNSEEIDTDPQKAREFVAKAIQALPSNFKKKPQARTNAVTIWYEDGYHVDFAIYRKRTDAKGLTIIEHAGKEWTTRCPSSITNWFNKINSSLSPDPNSSIHHVTVAKKQMRRIVRLLKYWSKSRSGWSLPSGLVLSVLVAECYQPDCNRDDIAFYATLSRIANRLKYNKVINNPIDTIKSLLVTDKDTKQVETLEKPIGFLD